jgi:hypothetical protein
MRELGLSEDCLACDVDEKAVVLKVDEATCFAPIRGGGENFGQVGKD